MLKHFEYIILEKNYMLFIVVVKHRVLDKEENE
jgi:hypothetical protein